MAREKQIRDQEIDILKGIGICFVVGAHAAMPFGNRISLFHMALFFMATGYLFRDKYSDDLKGMNRFIARRISTLYLPYCIWNSIFLLLHNFFLKINLYTDNEAFLQATEGNAYGLNQYKDIEQICFELRNIWFFSGESGFGGATWFLRALFTVSLLFVIVDWLLKKVFKEKIMVGRCICGILFLFLGNFLAEKGCVFPLNIHSCFSNYALLVLGSILKRISEWRPKEKVKTISYVLCGVISLLIVFIAAFYGTVNTNSGEYTSIMFFLIVSLAGWGFVYSLAGLIVKNAKIGCVFQYLGEHSIVILFTHFLCFKLLTLAEIIVLRLPFYMLASFPVLYTKHGLWFGYMLAGVGTPSVLYWCYEKISSRCKKRMSTKENYFVRTEKMKMFVYVGIAISLIVGNVYFGNWNTGTLFIPDNQIIYVRGISEDDVWVSDGAELRICNQNGKILHIQGEYTNEIIGDKKLTVEMNGVICQEYTIENSEIDFMLTLESDDCKIVFSGDCKYLAPAPDTRMFLFMKKNVEVIENNG